jgi:tungstate transport system substrate-binding protein
MPERPARALRLGSTIGPVDAGVVPALLAAYRAASGADVNLIAAGTGALLDRARDGAFDLLIVHAPRLEEQFVAAGYGRSRHELMANDFVLVGPSHDPAAVGGSVRAVDAFGRLATIESPFLTRGDRSGTHVKEIEIWEAAGIRPAGAWYQTARHGAEGNLATAREASERGCYTLLDRATVVLLRDEPRLTPLVAGDPLLLNLISVLAVSGRRLTGIDEPAADHLVAWLLGEDAQRLIADFGRAEHGQPLFFPRAPAWRSSRGEYSINLEANR